MIEDTLARWRRREKPPGRRQQMASSVFELS